MALRGKGRDRVTAALAHHRPFRAQGNAMSAIEGKGGTGRLEGTHLERYRSDNVTYTVYSYATPIAWVANGGLVRVPDVSYSVTTSHHQTLCRVYLAGKGER
jgi:hypothetical protein